MNTSKFRVVSKEEYYGPHILYNVEEVEKREQLRFHEDNLSLVERKGSQSLTLKSWRELLYSLKV